MAEKIGVDDRMFHIIRDALYEMGQKMTDLAKAMDKHGESKFEPEDKKLVRLAITPYLLNAGKEVTYFVAAGNVKEAAGIFQDWAENLLALK